MSETHHQTTFEAPEVEEVARLFPTYEIHTLIACGGMGAVYQATQRSLDRVVAIKILPREFSTDAAFRAGFESEAKAMAKLNHPNLIGVYDFGEAGGMLFIIMEYVAGKSLYHSAHGFAVEQAEALSIIIDICHGLAHAHEFGILHRDIKPSNILLDANASPKIGDFGLARALERQIEEGEQIFGTPGYTAPEVLEPPFTIDQRADIYSVGVMLHEMLTGKLPDADPRPASQICGCSPRLDAIIFRALHPDPKFRYGSAEELAGELEKISASPSRALLTTAKPAPGRALAAPGKAPAAARPLSAPGRAPLSPPKPHSALGGAKPATRVASSESSALPVILVSLLVVVVVIAFVVLSKKDPQPPAGAAPPAPEAPKLPGATPAEKGKPEEVASDPTAPLRNAKISIGHRVEPLFESHKRNLKSNLLAFEAAFRELPSVRFESGLPELIAEWESRGSRIPEALPGAFANKAGASELLADYLGKQKALEDALTSDLKSQSGIYVLELQNQVELLSKSGNQAAVDALEEEVRRVEADPGYFRSIMD